ncbi:MAG: hypothetical protein PGN25_05570 [Methylorubrum populi]
MRVIFGLLALAHLRWAAWEVARSDFYQREADAALDRAHAHREHSTAAATRAGFAAT